jgi:hypothetical protein
MVLEKCSQQFRQVHLSNAGFAEVMGRRIVMEEILLVPCVEESAVYLGNYPQWFVPNVLALEVGTETAKSRSARNAVAVVLNQLENCDNIRFARLLKMESNIRALNFIVRLTEQCNLDCA